MMTLSEKFGAYAQRRSRKTLVSRIFLFLSIWRERAALADLDPHMLEDIGVSEARAKSESTRPAWDAPSRWMN
ncbi:MAG: DUF1127 domain-containing protein [Silicimonas sp.]|nr:DUF1127 domain-containing protein [Silicimonas sp.]